MAVDSLWSSVVLLCPFSESLLDVKRHSISAFGGTALSSAVGTPFGAGNAAYFDGTNDYLALIDSSDWAFGTGDFLVETWVYPTSFPGGGVSNDIGLLYIPGTPLVFFYLDNATGKPTLWNGTIGVQSVNATVLNTWNYVWVKRASSTLTIGVGSTVGNTSASYTSNFTATTNATISSITGTRYLHGYLSNFRITKADRTITLPTDPFTRPTISGIVYDASVAPVDKTILVRDRSTQLYLGGVNSDPTTGTYTFHPTDFTPCQAECIDEICDPMTDECVFDLNPAPALASPGGGMNCDNKLHYVTFTGAVIGSDGNSIFFDGSNDNVQSSSAHYVLGTEDFSIELEFMPIAGSNGAGYARILQLGANATAGSLFINAFGGTNPMQVETMFYDTTYRQLGGPNTTTLANSTWHKLQLRRVNGVFTTTINGTTWRTSSATAYNITASLLSLGANTANGDNFYGYIGRVRISRGPLRAAVALSTSRFLTMPSDGSTGENARIYDRVIPG